MGRQVFDQTCGSATTLSAVFLLTRARNREIFAPGITDLARDKTAVFGDFRRPLIQGAE